MCTGSRHPDATSVLVCSPDRQAVVFLLLLRPFLRSGGCWRWRSLLIDFLLLWVLLLWVLLLWVLLWVVETQGVIPCLWLALGRHVCTWRWRERRRLLPWW